MCTDAFGLSLLWVLQWLMFPLVSNQDQATLQRNHEKGLNRPKQELELTLHWAAYRCPYSGIQKQHRNVKRSKNYCLPPVVKRNGNSLFMGRGSAVQIRQAYHLYHLLCEHWRRGFLGSTEQVFQNSCTGTHKLRAVSANWKWIFVCFFETICSCSLMCEAGCTNFSAWLIFLPLSWCYTGWTDESDHVVKPVESQHHFKVLSYSMVLS